MWQNPAKLNRTGLRQVFAWKKALKGGLCFCRRQEGHLLSRRRLRLLRARGHQKFDDAYSQFPMYAKMPIPPLDSVLAHIGFAIITPVVEDVDASGK